MKDWIPAFAGMIEVSIMVYERSILFNFVSTIGLLLFLIVALKLSADWGDKTRKPQVIEAAMDELIEAWVEGDSEFLNCEKSSWNIYRYTEVATLHASMCTILASETPNFGNEWFQPLPHDNEITKEDLNNELPEGYTMIELPEGYTLIEDRKSKKNAKNQ